MKIRKITLLAAALCLAGALFTACGSSTSGNEGQNSTGTSSSQNTAGSSDSSFSVRTRDIDGDGFVEDVVNDAENIADDVLRDAGEIIEDIIPDASGNDSSAVS